MVLYLFVSTFGWFRVYLYILSAGVLRPKRRHCGVYLGTLAEFATIKINVVSTQDDISKLVYSFVVARVERLNSRSEGSRGEGVTKKGNSSAQPVPRLHQVGWFHAVPDDGHPILLQQVLLCAAQARLALPLDARPHQAHQSV